MKGPPTISCRWPFTVKVVVTERQRMWGAMQVLSWDERRYSVRYQRSGKIEVEQGYSALLRTVRDDSGTVNRLYAAPKSGGKSY